MTPPRPPQRAEVPAPGPLPSNLPPPGQAAAALQRQLQEQLRARIEAQGPLRFDAFMQAALYAPGLGYYTNGSHKIGQAGDFVTAPEISDLFSRCIARFTGHLIEHNAQDILEVGGGRGTLAAGILQQLRRRRQLPRRYYLLEVSPELRQQQEQQLRHSVPELMDRVEWLSALPDRFEGLVLANEVLDAFAVRRFHRRGGVNFEQYVDWGSQGLCYMDKSLEDGRLAERLNALQLPDDYLSEVNFQAEDWIRTVAEHLHRGMILLIDYGFPRREYYHPQRSQGTLMCHYQHHAHSDPLILTGLQDITAHVDFTAMADAALAAGLEVHGYTTQAHFLLNSGIVEALSEDSTLTPAQHLRLGNEVKRLTLPQEMGEMFKVMALGRQWDTIPPGFEQYDLRAHL